METTFDMFLNEINKDPFFSHNIRMKKGYRPKYKSGMIAIRFLDDEQFKFPSKEGEYQIDYQDIFSRKKDQMSLQDRRFVENFEKKYRIKLSNYRSETSDFYIYFTFEPGQDFEEKMREISQDKIVKDVDYVDARGIENKDELEEISRDLLEIVDEYGDESTEQTTMKIKDIISRLQKIIL